MLHEYKVTEKHWEKHKTSQETKSHKKKSCHRSKTSPQGVNRNIHPLPLPLLVLLPLLLSLIGTGAYLIILITSALLYVDQNTLASLHVTASSRVSVKFVRRESVEAYRRDQAVQSEIERELENQENQENIPPPAYVAPELPVANCANQAGPRLVFGRLPLPILPIPEEIRIARDAIPERPRTPIPVFHYCYNPGDFLAPGQETDARSGNTSEVASGYQTPDANLANIE